MSDSIQYTAQHGIEWHALARYRYSYKWTRVRQFPEGRAHRVLLALHIRVKIARTPPKCRETLAISLFSAFFGIVTITCRAWWETPIAECWEISFASIARKIAAAIALRPRDIGIASLASEMPLAWHLFTASPANTCRCTSVFDIRYGICV